MRKRVLLDEQLPHTLRHYLAHHDTITAAYAGFAGLKNGELLSIAEAAGFEVLVTADKTLHYEQSLANRKIAVVSLTAVELTVIQPHLAEIVSAVDEASPNSFTIVNCGLFSRRRRNPSEPGPP